MENKENPSESTYKHGVVFIDFDGCISICNWRESLLPGNGISKTYGPFHASSPYDPPNKWLINMMASMFASGIKIIILTGRMEANRNISSDWLRINNVKYDWLEMRKDDDFRPSEIFKAEYVEKFYKEEVLMIFDDLSRVIDHFKSLGYPTFKVEAKV